MSHLGRSGTLLDPTNTLVSLFHSPVLNWCVPTSMDGFCAKGLGLKAYHHTLGMLQGGQSTVLTCFEGLLTHLPSCAFVQPRSTSLFREWLRLILLLGSRAHTRATGYNAHLRC